MKELTYTIAAEVFARFPEYRRGVVIAHGVCNGGVAGRTGPGCCAQEEAAARERLEPWKR